MDFFLPYCPASCQGWARVSIPDLRGHLRAETDTKQGLCGLLGRKSAGSAPTVAPANQLPGRPPFSFPHSPCGPPSPAGSTTVSPVYQILTVPPLRVTPLQREPFPSEVVGVDIAGQRVSLVQIRFRPRNTDRGPLAAGRAGRGKAAGGVGTVRPWGRESDWVFALKPLGPKSQTSIKEDS